MTMLTKWFRGLRAGLGRGQSALLAGARRRVTGKRPALKLAFDHLEDRAVPATFTVLNTLDSGAGSLRQAVLDANATPNIGGPDRIEFNIGAAYQYPDGSCTIQPLSRYTITDPVVIDGYTQAGASVNTLAQGENAVLKVEIDCRFSSPGVEIAANDSTVRGLAMNRSPGAGIEIVSNHSGNLIEGNFIGTDLSGTLALGCNTGVGIQSAAENNRIGGTDPASRNIIAGNVRGIKNEGNNTTVSGNWIGLGANALALPNEYGFTDEPELRPLTIRPSGLVIGGTSPGAGNVISGNSRAGVRVLVANAVVQGNLIGTDPTGTIGIGNGAEGVLVEYPSSSYNCVIGGTVAGARNVISGNQTGVSGLAFVFGNYIGTDYTGTRAIGNHVGVSATQVGGTTPEERNIISGNTSFGAYRCDVVSGNWIGIGADGSRLPNDRGVVDCKVIGGTAPGAGNVISGNRAFGIWLFGYGFDTPVRVEGNLIGTDPTGTFAIGNDYGGIFLVSPNNMIGGTAPGARNIISGNPLGIFSGGLAPGNSVQNNTIQGNWFGTDISGTQPIPNTYAISLGGGASNNLIGGTEPGQGNVIAHSEAANVRIGGVNNAILGNSIYGGWGIDLKIDDHQIGQPLPNDPGDGDGGYNNWQNYPVLTTASGSAAGTVITGTLNSLPLTTFRIELFANTNPQPNGHGPGERYLGFVNVTTDGNGDASFNVNLPALDPSQLVISSTATRLELQGGDLVPTDTSEFSANITAEFVTDVSLDLSGRVFRDDNNDGQFSGGDIGLSGVEVTLFNETDLLTPVATAMSGPDGSYSFQVSVPLGIYRIVESQPAGYLDGRETAGSLGGLVDNASDSNVISGIVVAAGGAATGYDFAEIAPARIQGLVWEDFNDDGLVDFGERAIADVEIHLTGIDDRGSPVNLSMTTDAQGIYECTNLRPSGGGGYSIAEVQPAGFVDGIESLGTVNGVLSGDALNDLFNGIELSPGADGANYNFGERPAAGAAVAAGQTATIGFWQNKNGQNLIKSLNGGASSTQLGNWLAATFPNMYGADAGANNLTGQTNSQVAAFYTSLFKRTSAVNGPPKTDAQVLATALAVYVTNQNLAGTAAVNYGFLVTDDGVGIATFDVGNANRAAFGLSANDSTIMTVMDILLATDDRTRNGLLYDVDDSGSISVLERALRVMANSVYSSINERGGI